MEGFGEEASPPKLTLGRDPQVEGGFGLIALLLLDSLVFGEDASGLYLNHNNDDSRLIRGVV